MINHARTLLRNQDPYNVGYGPHLGDEYVPTDFRKNTTVPSAIANVWTLLFGPSQDDQVFINYRLRQYMAILHATELVEFVTALDPRITYDVNNPELFSDALFGIATTPDDIFVSGELGPPDHYGWARHSWRITVEDSDTALVERLTPPATSGTQSYTMSDGLSSLVSLPWSGASVRFRQTIGKSWVISGTARPEKDLGQITADLESLGAPYMNSLFGVGKPQGASEPFKTFRNLWADHPEMSYRLGGVLLAVIYQLEALRSDK